MKTLNHFAIFCILFFSYIISSAQKAPDFVRYLNHSWVDSCLQEMTLEERIGQLFIVDVYANKEANQYQQLFYKIEKFRPGGILFMQGEADKQIQLTNGLQEKSKIPLLITMDAEWGPAFRLKNTPKYPVQMALGAINDDSLIYQMGFEIGTQLKQLGIGANFAPVADVNNNPENPVINFRSFGENPESVAEKSWLYAKGLQDAGVLAVAKHFPGHGDTKTDSHFGLPVVPHNAEHLDSVELKPFKHMIEQGVGGIMSAHLHVKYYNPDQTIPASLSKQIVRNKLIDDLGFSGLIVTDAMNMHGVSKMYSPGEAAIRALQAGNDMLEITPDLNASISAVLKAVQNGQIKETEIDWKCRKILAVKKWLKLDEFEFLENKNINSPKYEVTKRLLHEKSLTLLKNQADLLPLQKLDTLKIATVSINKQNKSSFQSMIDNYMQVDHFQLPANADTNEIQELVNYLKNYNLVICEIHGLNLSTKNNYGVNASITEILSKLDYKKTITVLFGNPYALNFIKSASSSEALLVTYQENKTTQELAAQAIFGAIDVSGKLPVTTNDFPAGKGLLLKKNGRLKYTIPEEVGISSTLLESKVDSLATLGITKKAYPGCQILIAKDGKVIFHKCYGFHTYKNLKPVLKENIYDWASITKITGPLPALIKLHHEKKFKLDVPFSFYYWPDFLNSNKKDLTAREILAHQAGLQAWIPYWHNTLKKNGKLRKRVFKQNPSSRFDLRVSSSLYMKRKYLQNMYDEIRDSELLPDNEYKYSGLAFYLFPKIIKNLTRTDYESYLKETFYKPLGASTVTFNAYKHFPSEIIIPTENDLFFRKELLQGFVHDEGAAMMGGVSGNAGLFGTANDLAKIMQMYLQEGYYGGEQFLEAESLKEFTRIQYPENDNRRGLGFDKPYIDNHENEMIDAYPAVSASAKSFGHSGYTGTFTWTDPEHDLLFIFFSNRVFPTRDNSLLYDLNLRPEIHQAIYDCFDSTFTIP